MKPRRLRVKGYTAFVEEADLDFNGLDLFAITGPTGAGKTSLLQGMTIALYGRAPKLGDDLRQLISPLAERAHFHFEFRAHGRGYRITRVMFRARPTTVALEAQTDDGQWETLTRGVREANTRVEEILGLDFDSFTKVVLLPQNEFDAFLRGKPEERRSILTKLLSLEIYGKIQQRANQKAAEARTRADLLTELVERDYAGATPERLAEVREARAAADAQAASATTRLGAIEHALAGALELRQHRAAHRAASEGFASQDRTLGSERAEHERAGAALSRLATQVQAVAERLAAISYDPERHLRLTRAAERAARLADVVTSLARLDREATQSRDRVEDLERRRAEHGKAMATAEGALAAAGSAEEKARVDLDERQRRFGTRAAIAGLVERERRYRDDCERVSAGEHAVKALTARQAELTAARRKRDSGRAKASAALEKARRVCEERERVFEECRTMATGALAFGQQLTAATDREGRAKKTAERAAADVRAKNAALREAEASRQSAQETARTAGERLRLLEQAHAAHHLRAALAVGHPCPVCETKVKKVPALELVADLTQAREAADETARVLGEAQRAEQQAAAAVAAGDEAVRAATAALEEVRAEIADLRRALPPEMRDDNRWPETLQKSLEEAAASRDAAERDVEKSARLVTDADAEIAGLDAVLKTLPAQMDKERLALDALRTRCHEDERELTAVLGGPVTEGAAAKLSAIDVELRDGEEALAAAATRVQSARAALVDARAAAVDADRQLAAETDRARARAEEQERLAREADEIRRALGDVVPGRADAADAIAAELTELDDARTRLEAARREMETRQRDHDGAARRVAELATRIATLEQQRDDLRARADATRKAMDAATALLAARLAEAGLTLGPGGEEHAQLGSVVARAREEREAILKRSAELGAEEQTLADSIARAADYREQRDAARTRMEVARELGQLLGANNLQNDLLADAMRVLVEDGSAHLQRLSDGRYRLRAEELDFHVVDAWNGDAVRSVKTLSGGETFLTSLALALALAERLADLATGAHGHEALESLFVDEGFGALDSEETLETVVQAIEALQAHDRVVGIVTHLTALAERMPAQIRVRKAPEGSRLEIVSA